MLYVSRLLLHPLKMDSSLVVVSHNGTTAPVTSIQTTVLFVPDLGVLSFSWVTGYLSIPIR